MRRAIFPEVFIAAGEKIMLKGSMPPNAHIRQKIGIVLLVVLTCLSVFHALRENIRSYREAPETDPVTVHERRIAQLKAFLPSTGQVGYITGIENEKIFTVEKTFTNVEFVAQYVLTQYTLAPLVVRNSPDFPIVIGNFIEGVPVPEFLHKNNLVELHDFGEGLFLYQKEKKR